MFGRVDMRKQSLEALFPLSDGIIASNGQRAEAGSAAALLDFPGYNLAEHRNGDTDLLKYSFRKPLTVFEK